MSMVVTIPSLRGPGSVTRVCGRPDDPVRTNWKGVREVTMCVPSRHHPSHPTRGPGTVLLTHRRRGHHHPFPSDSNPVHVHTISGR